MIVFRDQREERPTCQLLSRLRLQVSRHTGGAPPTHDEAVAMLIGMGSLESGLLDVLFPDSDGFNSIARRLRDASVALGHVAWHTWHNQPADSSRWLAQASATLSYLEVLPLPDTVPVSVSEGYAYYAVYPEMYLEAARRFRQTIGQVHAVCLGLRSIGTSLSAIVAASLDELGCQVASFTLRPHGHPFARRPAVTRELERMLQAERDSFFLVIDEGPGLSGSSLGGTAALLSELGVDDDRIVLFPSWRTDGSALRSPVARERWRRHQQFVVDFDEVWLDSGRIDQAIGGGRLLDLSAGRWRKQLCTTVMPPVQPQHERRKYLVQPGERGEVTRWMSFVGIGDRSGPKVSRAEQLADAGFVAAPELVAHGFLLRAFTPGEPISAAYQVDECLLERLARYLAHIAREMRADPSMTSSMLQDMVTTNVTECLGGEWHPRLKARLSSSGDVWCQHPVALDGRMLPHEWIQTSSGFLKTDAIDHHDDHFFPGCQDIAWDIASACLEFDLTPDARRRLIQRYRLLSDDRTISARLPLHAVTYLAYRLGYTTMAAETLGEDPDGARFAAAATRYANLLRSELGVAPDISWDA